MMIFYSTCNEETNTKKIPNQINRFITKETEDSDEKSQKKPKRNHTSSDAVITSKVEEKKWNSSIKPNCPYSSRIMVRIQYYKMRGSKNFCTLVVVLCYKNNSHYNSSQINHKKLRLIKLCGLKFNIEIEIIINGFFFSSRRWTICWIAELYKFINFLFLSKYLTELMVFILFCISIFAQYFEELCFFGKNL